ncbi:MAG: hypothetical protein JWM91_3675, partial [Rhodospirillales bacterium]|nr:hypothetical protein [Rhodospirillales bacterium]
AANGLAISQSSTHGIINWQSFSIAAGQSVNIANGAGATLNRVTGGDLSSIAGSLTATGSVYVVNPSGVVILPGGKVVTGGSFVASTRDISNSSFMAGGTVTLSGNSSGALVNQGTITSTNGDVILVGKSVTNSGSISAAKGTAALAAGDNVLLQASGDGAVLVYAGSGDVTNSGTIAAAQAELNAVGGNVYALATNNGGLIRATGTTTKDGHVYLTGGGDVGVEGTISATNADRSGGKIVATASSVDIGATAKISADGTSKGGTILIGGDRHGGTDASVALSTTPIKNAQTTNVAPGATISADAETTGNGGNVVVWSDQSTSYSGAISAKGGTAGGDGGFVEVSGKAHLDYSGIVTTAAVHGATGTLLLDPTDVTIVDGSGSYVDNTGTVPVTVTGVPTGNTNETKTTAAGTTTYTPSTNQSFILNSDIVTALGANNVLITTSSSGTAAGNILVAAPIVWNTANSLSLVANGYIKFGGDYAVITANGTGGIGLTASGDDGAFQYNGILVGAPISAHGGLISITSMDTSTHVDFGNLKNQGVVSSARSTDTITNTSGDINIVTNFNITVQADIRTTNGGNINLISKGTNSLMQIANTVTVETTGVGSILLQSDTIVTGTGNEPTLTGAVVTDTTLGKVTAQRSSAGLIDIGSAAATPFLLDQDIANITTHTLVIGSDGVTTVNGFIGGATAGIRIADNLNADSFLATGGLGTVPPGQNTVPLATVGNLVLKTSSTGFVTENTPDFGNYAIAVHGGTGGLAISAGTYIDMTGTGDGGNKVGSLSLQLTGTGVSVPTAANNSGTTSLASIQFGGDAASGALTIGTVDAQSGITGATTGAGGVYLSNTGAVTQDTSSAANKITASSLDLEGGATATYALDNAGNSIGSIAGNFATLSLHDNIGLTTTVINSTSGLNGTGDITIVDNGNLTIANLAAVKTSGGNIRLEDQTFTNAYAGNAFSVGAGKNWRVYSQNPTLDTNGTQFGHSNDALTYSFVQYNAPNSYASPFTATLNVAATGNGFVYSVAPNVTETLSGTFDKGYDGTNTVTGNITSSNYAITSGVINGDNVTFNNPTGSDIATYDSFHAGVNRVITLNTAPTIATSPTDRLGVTIYGYGSTIADGLTGTISQAPLTITGTKTYTGTSGFVGSHLTAAGAITGDTIAVTGGSTGTAMTGGSAVSDQGTYAGSAVSASITIGASTNGSLATDYIVPTTGTLTITPIMLTVSGTKVYTGTANADAVTLTTPLPGELSADVTAGSVTLTGSGTLIGPNASNVGSYSTLGGTFSLNTLVLSLTGAQAGKGNYVLAGASYTITPANLTITADLKTKVYGTNDPTLTFVASGFLGTDTAASVAYSGALARVAGETVAGGPYAIGQGTLATAAGSNYAVTTFTGANLTITPRAVTLTGTRIYDGLTDANSDILSVTDIVGTDHVIVTSGSGVLAGKNVATETITSPGTLVLGGADAGNYTLTGFSGSVNVTKANLVISAVTDMKVYDGTTGSVGTPTVTGLQTGDTISTTPLVQAFGSKDVLGTNGSTLSVINYSAVNDGNSDGNYSVAVNTAPGTITPLAVNATGTRVYNGTPGVDGSILTITNKITGDDLGMTGTGTLETKHVGPRDITDGGKLTLTGGDAGNYTAHGGSATVTITPFSVNLAGTRVYDGLADGNASILHVTNAFAGDTVTVASGTSTIASKNVGPEGITNFGTLTLSNNTAGDYTLVGATGTVTVTPLAVTLTGTRVYNGLTDGNSSILSVTNGFARDNVTVASGTSTIASKNVGPEAITNFGTLALGNNAAGNYTLIGATGTVTVAPIMLTVTAVPTTKTYDGTTASSGTPVITEGSLKGTDTGGFIQQYGTKNAGTGLTLTPSGIVTDGNGGNNYIVTFAPIATGITNRKAVVLTGTRPFDNTPAGPATILTITDLIPGDLVTLGGSGTLASPNVGTEAISSFTGLTLGGGAAGNYTFVGATGSVVVTPINTIPNIAELLVVPATQTSSGTGETVSFAAFDGGILTLTPKQNGIVTGTIATIDGTDYHPDTQLGCTLGSDGCIQNGVAATPAR